jgi:hypothetical protein
LRPQHRRPPLQKTRKDGHPPRALKYNPDVMKASTSFEQQISRIYELLEESGGTVTWDDHIPDPDNPTQPRQIDVSIRNTHGALTLVECRDHKSPQDVQWIEELIGRRISLAAQSVIAVSSSGFTSGAVAKGKAHGITLRELEQLTDDEIIGWGQQISITLYFYAYSNLDVELFFESRRIESFDIESVKTELKSHPCLQSMFNAAANYFRESEALPFDATDKSVKFEFKIVFDGFKVCGELVSEVLFRGEAKLVSKHLGAPVIMSYQQPSDSAQVDVIVENFRSLGYTSIAHSGNRVFTFIDLSQLEIPPFWLFRYCRIESEQEIDHQAFELSGIEKIRIAGKGLNVKLCTSA